MIGARADPDALPWPPFPEAPRKLEVARDTRYLIHRVSVECRTFRPLLVTLYRHDTNTSDFFKRAASGSGLPAMRFLHAIEGVMLAVLDLDPVL